MTLKERMNQQAASKKETATQTVAAEIFERWSAKLLERPDASEWEFGDTTAGGEAVAIVIEWFAAEGFTVTFQPARDGGSVQIVKSGS